MYLQMVEHANRVAELLKKRGWNQVILAKKTGLTQSQISMILSGRRLKIRLDTVEKIAKGFNMTLDEYMGISVRVEPEKLDALAKKLNNAIKDIPKDDPVLRAIEDIIDGYLMRRRVR